MTKIHPTAVVSSEAVLGEDVSIGAYSIVKGPVTISPGTVIHEHTHVQGKTRIGENCQIGPAAFVGLPPQHLHADLDIGELIIGNNVTIRETASVHRATAAGDEQATRIGDKCFLMGGVHVGHDCVLGEAVVLANAALLGGHCRIGDRAFLGGGCTLHQHMRVGRLAIIGGNEAVTQEVPPFAAVRYGGLKGYNAVGCQRVGLSRESIHALRAAFRCLHNNRVTANAVAEIRRDVPQLPEVLELIEFITSASRGVIPSVGGRRRIAEANGELDGSNPRAAASSAVSIAAVDGTQTGKSFPRRARRSVAFPATADRTALPTD